MKIETNVYQIYGEYPFRWLREWRVGRRQDPAQVESMSEMVERVALAISGGDDPASILSIHRHRARAAIEAMREPTDEMVHAGLMAGCRINTVEGWRAMVDEASK